VSFVTSHPCSESRLPGVKLSSEPSKFPAGRAASAARPAANQRALDLRNEDGTRLTFQRPLLGVESVRALTGLCENEILSLIADGKLLWAWNLATAHASRIFLRVWNKSVICYVDPNAQRQPTELAGVLQVILPHGRETFRCADLKRTFNCNSEHILRLAEQGLLERVPGKLGPANHHSSPAPL
jgi:hypothetical protein